MSTPRVSTPTCQLGYTVDEIKEITGDRFEAFEQWFAGQAGAICDGKKYNHEIREYEKTGCGPHGFIIYPWDLERFLQGQHPLD